MRARALLSLVLPALLISAALGQSFDLPEVVVLPVETVTIHPGESAPIRFSFRIKEGFHVNSSKPIQQNLIPTSIKLSPPTDIMVGRIKYPEGEQLQLPFMPDEKLSVYSGAVQVSGMLKTTNAISPSTYRVRGVLRYQACTDRQCLPPRTADFTFDVKVVRVKRPHHNPPQSPHAHS